VKTVNARGLPGLCPLYVNLLTFFFISVPMAAQQPAFPGAEGYGKFTSGGRGGAVYKVTNLDDSGPGSLRDAVSQSNRTVVFRVSGNIELKSELVIRGSNLTVAGQTAPGDGICVRDYPTKIDGNNVIVRFMRFRLGDRYGLSSDALDINDQNAIILDHCTMSWGADECFSAYGNTNVTVQWCIIGEGLNYQGHSMGGLWGGYTSYHHNLIHTSNTRHPKYAYTYDEDITDSRNNVIYNWGYNSAYTSPTGRVNLVNNYYKSGPATGSGVRDRIVQAEPTKRMYITGNYVAGFPEITADNWNGGVDPLNGGLPIRYDEPFTVPNPIPEQSATDAYLEIIRHVGASFPKRDDADNRAIKNLVDSTGMILMRQGDAGGFPVLASLPPPEDRDHDGMPDAYETGLGLDPDDPGDRNGDKDGNGYTNLEDYLNGMITVTEGIPRPGFVSAEAVAEDRVEVTWFDLCTDEQGFSLERSTDSISFTEIATLDPDTQFYLDSDVEALTTYYYRVRTFRDTATSEWSCSEGTTTFAAGAAPGQAVIVSPADGQAEVNISGTVLRWEAGNYTLRFNVYLGKSETALDLVDSATEARSWSAPLLDFGTQYFWRVDALNNNGITTGETWNFSTLEGAEPELVLYWPFLETDGNTVLDSSGNHNDGIVQNISVLQRADGPFSRAIDLGNSGPTGHIQVPDNLSIAFDENPFSISFWMRVASVPDSSIYIFHKGSFNAIEGTERNGRWFGLEMRDGIFRFSVDDNDTKTVVGGNTTSFVTGEWVHVVIIRDVYRSRLYLYKNTKLTSYESDQTGSIRVDMPLLVGNSDHMYPQYYGGNIDENSPYRGELAELVICRHPLSDEERENLYLYNRIPTFPAPVRVPEAEGASDLRAYPNPFQDRVCLEFSSGMQNRVVMEVMDLNGRIILNREHSVIPGRENRVYWDGSGPGGDPVAPGIYMILLKDANGTPAGRALVVRN
jgi:hypothetical protein